MRASHRRNLELSALEGIARTHFDTVGSDASEVTASYGAIERLVVRPQGRGLLVEILMRPNVPDEVARATIDRYNGFLEETTGFNAKERARRLRKSAGE